MNESNELHAYLSCNLTYSSAGAAFCSAGRDC